jgi:hypothetical protein
MSVARVCHPSAFFRGSAAAVFASRVRQRVKSRASSGLFQWMTAVSARRSANSSRASGSAVLRVVRAKTASPVAARPAWTA